jgi:ABC-type hemin transport system ATPase subunit
MHEGRVLAAGAPRDILRDERVATILGRTATE